MKNREKFAEQILDIVCQNMSTFALVKESNRLVACSEINCAECAFSGKGGCTNEGTKWANSEYIEKPKISESDRRFLEYLPSEEAWIVRDESGHLYIYRKNKPKKSYSDWCNGTDCYTWLNELINVDFPMVKWEDEEPWLIEDLKKLEVEA